jgi:hypothetical protein
MKKILLTLFITLLSINILHANIVLMRAASETYKGKRVGAVYINDKVVMRFYAKGKYINSYNRAKEVIQRMTDIATKGVDLRQIQIVNNEEETYGIAGTIEVFRIYTEDISANNSVPISLATAWTNNIRNAIDYNTDEALSPKDKQLDIEDYDKNIEENFIDEGYYKGRELTLKQKMISIKNKFITNTSTNMLMLIIQVLLVTIFLFLLISMILQIKKHKLQKKGIINHASSEELENIVTHLISELENKAAEITTDFQQKVNKLENLMTLVDKKVSGDNDFKFPKTQKSKPTKSFVSDDVTVINAITPEKEEAPEPKPEPKPEQKVKDILNTRFVKHESSESFKVETEDEEDLSMPVLTNKKTKQELIYDYSDKGKTVTEIAQLLSIGTGEVQLILDLKP